MKLLIKPGQDLYFTSDTHYSHANICRATTKWKHSDGVTRDFKSLEHMNDTIVNSINATVKPDDILIHLGDWSFGGFDQIKDFSDRVNCNEIHLFLGNHDHHIARNKNNIKSEFTSVRTYDELLVEFEDTVRAKQYGSLHFVLFHYPIASWNGMNKGVIHLHGHVHLHANNKIANGKAMDVGCDGNNMTPYSVYEIVKIMKMQPIKVLSLPHDHHETDVR